MRDRTPAVDEVIGHPDRCIKCGELVDPDDWVPEQLCPDCLAETEDD